VISLAEMNKTRFMAARLKARMESIEGGGRRVRFADQQLEHEQPPTGRPSAAKRAVAVAPKKTVRFVDQVPASDRLAVRASAAKPTIERVEYFAQAVRHCTNLCTIFVLTGSHYGIHTVYTHIAHTLYAKHIPAVALLHDAAVCAHTCV
jgi:hypothetical protein